MDKEKEGFVGKVGEGGGPTSVGSELVAQGASLIRLENTTQIQISMQNPRDEAKILGDALKELDLYPSMAEEVLYSKPVGKDENNKMKYAEGLSIRTAESLANRWKNSAYGCDIVSEDAEGVILAAVFLDYENNCRHVLQKKVSRYYKSKQGQKVLHPADRFADVVIPANQSKLLREVILRSLPAGLKLEYEAKARTILGSGDAKKRTTKLVAGFIRLGISKSKLEELAGKIDDLSPEEITNLIGVGNAIRDGETTIDQLIIEKNNAEKLQDVMSGDGAKKGPDAAKPADLGTQSVSTPTAAAPAPTEAGLSGDRLALYNLAASKGAGDLFETDALLAKHSSNLIKNKADLLKADDALVASVLKKLQKG